MCKMMAVILGILFGANAWGYEPEGVYSIVSRDPCEADRIDTVVIYEGAHGEKRALLTSYQYGVVYQIHEIDWDGGDNLSGYSSTVSLDAGTMEARISADFSTLQGTVDAASCPGPWRFVAQRQNPGISGFQGTSGAFRPELSAFAGDFAIRTDRNAGTLRLLHLPDGRLVGTYGVDIVPRLITFQTAVLKPEEGILELFSYDGGIVQTKWKLTYGGDAGAGEVFGLEGYGFSATARIYPVSAARL